MRILKPIHICISSSCIIYLIFASFFNFRPISLFISEYKSIEREHRPEIDSGTSFFLGQILKKFLFTWRMTRKFIWIYQPNLGALRGEGGGAEGGGEIFVSKMRKVGLVFYIAPYLFYFQRVSVYLLYFSQ